MGLSTSGRVWCVARLAAAAAAVAALVLVCGVVLASWSTAARESRVRSWMVDPKARSDALEQHIADTCKTLRIPDTSASSAFNHMIYDDARKVIFCVIPKIASTNWKRVWLKMTGRVRPEGNLSSINRYAVHNSLQLLAMDEKKEEKLRTYQKLMIVRHPFERVLSAYRDKLEQYEHKGWDFQKHIGKKILKKYRGTNEGEGDNVTFPEFIRFISEPGLGTPAQQNEHWLPMYQVCQPCAIKYEFIGKYENLQEDTRYLLQWLGVADMMEGFPPPSRPFHASRYDPKYYGQLSHQEIMAFYAKYLPDFLLFDYGFV